jgi:hypothetical protein
MKKISLYMSLALAGLFMTACHEDFDDWAQPQSFAEPTAISISGLTASALGTDIDLNTDAETVKVLNLSQATLPEGTILESLRMEITPDGTDGSTTYILKALSSTEGTFSRAELQHAVVDFFGPRPTARKMAAHVLLDGVVNGQAALINAGDIVLSLIPKAPVIASAYYLIGGPNDWQESAVKKMLKFQHSGKDVYEDPVFTIIFDASEGDTWFAIGDDESCDAIAAGDWTKLFGIVGGDSETKSGSLDYRYNLGGDNSFKVAAGAKKIKVVINMLDRTFEVTPVSISDAYYLIGGPGNWDNSKNQKFTHSDKDVFDDPVFTYVFEGSGSDMWFAFGDDEAIDAVGENVWNKLFGTTGASEDLSGTFKRRYDLDGDHSFHVDGTAKFYRFSANMLTGEYTITPLNFAEYIWEAGVNNSWGADAQPLYCADGNGTYTGFFYAQDADWSDGMGAFKFTGAFNDWNQGNYGSGTSTDEGGTLINSNESGNLLATPGFYRAEVNLADMTYKLTRINGIGIIGPAQPGGWDTDTDMTYNPETRAWEATVTLAADELKFRANDAWDINWGGELNNLTQNGANLKVEKAGKYFIQFFPLCETKSYATITAVD